MAHPSETEQGQCHTVVWFMKLDHMSEAGSANSERLKLWDELVGWLLCLLNGYRNGNWSSEVFLELKQISSEACGVTDTDSDIAQFGIVERCHTVLAAMWIMDKCKLSAATVPYQWDIDIFHKDGKHSVGAYDPGDSD